MELNFKLIVGLGNPEPEYENTYHNLGLFFVEKLADSFLPGASFKKEKYFWFLKTDGIIFIKPKVFMNESGVAVKAAIKFFSNKEGKILPEKILIIHDDSDLNIGDFKMDFDRGAAGHKGVLSVAESLKTNRFWRLRIGIRPPEEQIRQKAGEFVLRKIPTSHKEVFQSMVEPLKIKVKEKTNP
jgi:PTH1 family peptidyl-tRNA hydrolase